MRYMKTWLPNHWPFFLARHLSLVKCTKERLFDQFFRNEFENYFMVTGYIYFPKFLASFIFPHFSIDVKWFLTSEFNELFIYYC